MRANFPWGAKALQSSYSSIKGTAGMPPACSRAWRFTKMAWSPKNLLNHFHKSQQRMRDPGRAPRSRKRFWKAPAMTLGLARVWRMVLPASWGSQVSA